MARCCMIREPRNWSRRWSSITSGEKRVRKVASSRAVSPPPTTAMRLPLKKKPSHVAHAETPRPRRRVSLSRPSHNALAPVATTTESAVYIEPPAHIRNGGPVRSTRSTSTSTRRAPKRSAWSRIRASVPVSAEWAGRSQVADLGQHIPPDEFQLGQIPDVADAEDGVLGPRVGPGAQPVHQPRGGQRTLGAVRRDGHAGQVGLL